MISLRNTTFQVGTLIVACVAMLSLVVGIVGRNHFGEIEDSFNAGAVQGATEVGAS